MDRVRPARQQLAFIAFGALWPVLLNTIDGARSADPVGPSGCGKSTLLRCIAGLHHPARGTSP